MKLVSQHFVTDQSTPFRSGAIQPQGFAVVGMAALFAGVVRAPLAGIVLVTEMTANVTMLLPMIVACFVAMAVPTALGDPPVYDSLRARLSAHQRRAMQRSGQGSARDTREN